MATATTGRDQVGTRQAFEQIKKAAGASQGLLLTSAPRAGLQIMQPGNASEILLKAYARDFHGEDRLSWQTILRGEPVRLETVTSLQALEGTPYGDEWIKRYELAHVVAIPLSGPAWEGYPGVMHLGRTAEEGAFSQADITQAVNEAREVDERMAAARETRVASCSTARPDIARPPIRLAMIDGDGKVSVPVGNWEDVDSRLRSQMTDQSRRRLTHMNGDGVIVDRVLLSDSHGDSWPFRVVTYKSYPAISAGSVSIFCIQPDCCEWAAVRPVDFSADPELSRLLPAIRYMEQEFSKGPTLVDIAKQVELSPFHFHRRFTELLGLTPKQYLLDCQIHQAKADLLSREKELVQIAKECGFAHQSHFTSRFKQATGLTPTRWRRMASAKVEASEN